jgi:hypothetical protein
MEAADYREEVRLAYLGEVRAAETFDGLLDRLVLTDLQRSNLAALRDVERYVASVLAPVLERLGLAPDDTVEAIAEARSRVATIDSWAALVARLGDRLLPYIARYDALRDAAGPADRDAMRLLSEHEHALLAFGRLERDGEGERSLAVLLAVLPG